MPILIRAYRIPLAEVIAPLMQSAFGSISCNLGAAAFAAGPRFPRAVATQYRTESSGESSRDVISVTSDSMTSLLLIFCVRLARRSAASVLASTVLSERTFTMVSLNCFISAGPPLASAMSTPGDNTKQRARQSSLKNRIFIPPLLVAPPPDVWDRGARRSIKLYFLDTAEYIAQTLFIVPSLRSLALNLRVAKENVTPKFKINAAYLRDLLPIFTPIVMKCHHLN